MTSSLQPDVGSDEQGTVCLALFAFPSEIDPPSEFIIEPLVPALGAVEDLARLLEQADYWQSPGEATTAIDNAERTLGGGFGKLHLPACIAARQRGDDRIAGAVITALECPWDTPHARRPFILDLLVDEPHRNQGLGSALLLNAVRAIARTRAPRPGSPFATAYVDASNDSSLRLFERAGATRVQ